MTIGFIIISAIIIIALAIYVKRAKKETDSELTETEKESLKKQNKMDDDLT